MKFYYRVIKKKILCPHLLQDEFYYLRLCCQADRRVTTNDFFYPLSLGGCPYTMKRPGLFCEVGEGHVGVPPVFPRRVKRSTQFRELS